MEGSSLSTMDWKKKYLLMEGKLRQYRMQATNIRNKISHKMEELTMKCAQAEERAADADYQLGLLQSSMAGVPGAMSEVDEFNRRKILDLEKRYLDEQERNMVLEKELESERYLRKLEKESLQEKALKIKEWVSTTLNTAAREKQELQDSNARLNAAVQSMQHRITELLDQSSSSQKTLSASINDARSENLLQTISDLEQVRKCDGETETSLSPSSPRSPFWQSNPLFGNKVYPEARQPAPSQSPSPASMELEQCDLKSNRVTSVEIASASVNSAVATSEAIGRKKFPSNFNSKSDEKEAKSSPLSRFVSSKLRSTAVKSAVDSDILSQTKEPDSSSKNISKSSTLPMTKSASTKTDAASPASPNSSQSHHNFMGTFGSIRKKFKGLTEYNQKRRSHEDAVISSRDRGSGKRDKRRSKSKSPGPRSSSMTRQGRPSFSSVAKINLEIDATSPSLPVIPQEEGMAVDQSHILLDSPSTAVTLSSSPAFTCWKTSLNSRPPTPPLHQLPRWQTKIYVLPKDGFKISTSASSKASLDKNTNFANMDYEPGEYAEVVYKLQPLTIPVYTKIKGRATRIRPIPFTDASDSSDDDSIASSRSPLRQLSPRHTQRPSRSLSSSADVSNAAIQQRRNGSPGMAKAMKRANSQQSMASSEGDYAIPPDAQIGFNYMGNSDSSEPEHKLIKTSKHQSHLNNSSRSTTNVKKTTIIDIPSIEILTSGEELSGYMSKLGGRVRTWKRRWFVLRNQTLFYFKSSNDVTRKPQGKIALAGSDVKIVCDVEENSTFQIKSRKRTYYLTVGSHQAAACWIKSIQTVIGDETVDQVIISTSGWLTRTVGGSSCRVWARLRDSALECYERDDKMGETPFDRLSLRKCVIEDVQLNMHSPIVGGNTRMNISTGFEHVIVIKPSGKSGCEIFLSFETNSQKTSWLRHLAWASRSSTSSPSQVEKVSAQDPWGAGTDYERLVVKLLQSEPKGQSDTKFGGRTPSLTLWRNPVLSYSKEGISRPLTTLPSDALQTEAMKLAKSIQLFINVSLDTASAEYHITLAQRIAQVCLTHALLRNEVFSQLIKLTNRRQTEITNAADLSYLQGWKLLALLLPLFLPQGKLLWLLKAHLKRHSNTKTEVGQYIIYCSRTMERTSIVGERVSPPSRIEALCILLQNPYNHSLPFSVPVYFSHGAYEVISFDGSTTASEFSNRITVQSGLRHHTTSGFGLFVDDPDLPITSGHYVEPSVKLCDVISSWETVSRHDAVVTKQSHSNSGENESNRTTARFSFLQRLHFKMYQSLEGAKERLLLVYQIAEEISRDRFPLSRDLAIKMTSLVAQLCHGDKQYDLNGVSLVDSVIKRFYPMRYRSKHQQKQLRERIAEYWTMLKGTSEVDCVKIFLNIARKWPLCHSSLFIAKVETSGKHKGDVVWLSVNEDGLNILNYRTMELLDKCEYTDLVTFGGCKSNLMVVSQMAGVSRKLFFSMNRVQMLELTRAMSDYINASSGSGKESIREASPMTSQHC